MQIAGGTAKCATVKYCHNMGYGYPMIMDEISFFMRYILTHSLGGDNQ